MEPKPRIALLIDADNVPSEQRSTRSSRAVTCWEIRSSAVPTATGAADTSNGWAELLHVRGDSTDAAAGTVPSGRTPPTSPSPSTRSTCCTRTALHAFAIVSSDCGLHAAGDAAASARRCRLRVRQDPDALKPSGTPAFVPAFLHAAEQPAAWAADSVKPLRPPSLRDRRRRRHSRHTTLDEAWSVPVRSQNAAARGRGCGTRIAQGVGQQMRRVSPSFDRPELAATHRSRTSLKQPSDSSTSRAEGIAVSSCRDKPFTGRKAERIRSPRRHSRAIARL